MRAALSAAGGVVRDDGVGGAFYLSDSGSCVGGELEFFACDVLNGEIVATRAAAAIVPTADRGRYHQDTTFADADLFGRLASLAGCVSRALPPGHHVRRRRSLRAAGIARGVRLAPPRISAGAGARTAIMSCRRYVGVAVCRLRLIFAR